MDFKIFGAWDFFHWGKGWDSVEQARDWDLFWKSFNETHPVSGWRYLEIGNGAAQEHLLVCGQCVVWLHPMNYTAYYHGSGESVQTMVWLRPIYYHGSSESVQTMENGKWVTRREYLLEELEEICKEVAKVCNGTYTHKETEVEIINKE